jgi:uncharacterized RDD family membrane protein YckC
MNMNEKELRSTENCILFAISIIPIRVVSFTGDNASLFELILHNMVADLFPER